MLTDTHSHIYSEEFDGDRAEAIARAESAGVGLIILPAIDRDSYARQEDVAAARPDLFREMMGLHPTSVGADYEAALADVRERLDRHPDRYVGIGEIGLDFYWDTTYKEQQTEVLERQLLWAKAMGKPVALHLRSGKEDDAYAAIFALLAKIGSTPRGIMHCFSGSVADAQRAVAAGFLIGIGGVVTYKKSLLPDVVRAIPIESIVLETDCPYLAPVPYRGRRNESAYVAVVAESVAAIKGLSVNEVASQTTVNARALFGI